MNTSLVEKYEAIKGEFQEQPIIYTEDVVKLFSKLKRNTVNWTLTKLVEAGYLRRVHKGAYSINEWRGKNRVSLSESAEKVKSILDETGFEYYISGIDIILRYMHHVPEQYPVILFVEKNAKDSIRSELRQQGIRIIEPTELRKAYEDLVFSGDDSVSAVMYVTDNFEMSDDGIATPEKAFLDLYYAISRNGYPVSLQELARIYQNMIRLGTLDKKKLLAAAVKRNLKYDIRFIVESKYITESAYEFVAILRKGE